VLRSPEEPGATLYTASPTLLAALRAEAPQLSAGAIRWRYLKSGLAFLAFVLASSAAIWAFDLSPARAIAGWIPDRTWAQAGRQVAQNFTHDKPLCTDPGGRAALDKMVERLAGGGPKGAPFEVHATDIALVNAFAMPGGQLMLTRGLLQQAASPEEVAGVLAHEMGHASARHAEAGIVRALGISLAAKLLFSGTSDVIQSMGTALLQLRYTRAAEREADDLAYVRLKERGIPAAPLADFFDRMSKKEGRDKGSSSGGRASEILSSHPALEDRAAKARSQPAYPTSPILTAQEWNALKEICKRPPG
jgi:predicted Zn-dependent protease